MNLLAFDTSAAHCAAALLRDQGGPLSRTEPMTRGQSERLIPMLDELLAEARVTWSDLTAIAVCVGPGNFTGLRLSVAAARGLSFSLGIPTVGITLFEALAFGHESPALALARNPRGGVFSQLFLDGEPATAPGDGLPDTSALPRDLICVGHEAEGIANQLGAPRWKDQTSADPVAIAHCAQRYAAAAPPPKPLYLRPADASPSSEPRPLLLDDA